MTGAGTARTDGALGRFEAEARSVNHRFLKTSVRASGPLPSLDGAIEDVVRSAAERGHVSVSVRFSPATGAASRIDEAAFAAASARLKGLAMANGLSSPTVAEVLAVPGVLETSGDEEGSAARVEGALDAVRAALAKMNAAREREGEALRREASALLESIAKGARAVESRASAFPQAAKARLEARLAELLGPSVPLDAATVAREVALLADRADVREEVARLEAHVAHAREVLEQGGAVGRRLDFLVQEMHREANTVGSKCDDLEVTRVVLDLKTAVERLREQAQNLE
jgi:uncharacterized protein (TIGR00255 family)